LATQKVIGAILTSSIAGGFRGKLGHIDRLGLLDSLRLFDRLGLGGLIATLRRPAVLPTTVMA
jgi:hypothetical protein